MKSRSKEYWKKRFEQLEESLHKKAIDTFNDNKVNFELAEKKINDQIAIWYQRFATNNEISMSDAKKLLKSDELEELKWDINEYIKYGRENALNQKWMKELENASAKFHISRLEALKIRVRNTVEQLYQSENELLDTHLKGTYTSSYYHSCFEIQKGFGIGFDIGTIDLIKIKKVLSNPWASDEKNFSDRIWQSRSQLINELNNELTTMCLLGKAPDEAIKNISKKFNVSRVQAGRLVMTESAFISSAAQKDCFNELDVEAYEILATLDSHTSTICRDLDGTVFPMSEYKVGVTAPPFHPNCRTTTIPAFDDEYDISTRAARDENGKTYYVPNNMKYNDWKKKYVKDSQVNVIEEVSKNWIDNSSSKKTILKPLKEGDKFIYNEKEYIYDGKQIKYDLNSKEEEFAKWLSSKKKNIYFNPTINEPDGISTADLTIDDELYDMKIISGKSNQILYHNIRGKEKQASNFLFEATESSLTMKELNKQVQKVFERKDMYFVNKIGIKKDEQFQLYKRK